MDVTHDFYTLTPY